VTPQVKLVDHPALEPDYRAELVLRLTRELMNGPRDFASIVRAAEGAYPTDVLAALRHLEDENQAYVSSSGQWTHCENLAPIPTLLPHSENQASESFDDLPEAHPVDFDWRFTRATITDLAKRITPSATESVAILGAPTLYRYLVDSGINAWLFDKNPHIVAHLRTAGYVSVTECDLLEFSAGTPRFHWAMADPPWYVDHYEAFITAGRRLLLPEGRLLLSVLPRLTRPAASMDRFHILEFATNVGLDLLEVNPSVLHYVSPPFETEALRAEGLTINDWRTGDLFSFVTRSYKLHTAKANQPGRADQWQSVQFGKTTVKIKREQPAEAEPFDYQPASPSGSIRLRSVSRRSPVRSKINMWTSRNVALKISKPVMLTEALGKIANGTSVSATLASMAYEYQLSEPEMNKLRQLLQLLIQDAGLTWNS